MKMVERSQVEDHWGDVMGNGGCSGPARGLAVGQSPTSLHVGEAIDKVSLAGKTAEAMKRIIDSSSQRVMVKVCGWFVWRGKLSSEKIGSFGFRGSWGVGGERARASGFFTNCLALFKNHRSSRRAPAGTRGSRDTLVLRMQMGKV